MADEKTSEKTGTVPSWMLGAGLDTDMSGDVTAGAGRFIRFWMPAGSEKTIVFLTNGGNSPVMWEHGLYLGGSWQNWATCLSNIKTLCRLCTLAEKGIKSVSKRYKGQFFSVIDTSKYKDKKGNEHANEKKLLCAKFKTTEMLKRKWLTQKEAGRDFRGAMYKVFRTSGDKSPSVGEDFEYIKHIDLASYADVTELDYAELIGPDPMKIKSLAERIEAMYTDESSFTPPDHSDGSSGGTEEGTDAKVDY